MTLQVLMHHVWPLLGISSGVHRALYAWVLFRQAVISGDGSLLEGELALHVAPSG